MALDAPGCRFVAKLFRLVSDLESLRFLCSNLRDLCCIVSKKVVTLPLKGAEKARPQRLFI